MQNTTKTNITYHPTEKYRISHKCVICGAEMLPCSPVKKYCKSSCKKVDKFNEKNNTSHKTLKEVENYKNLISQRGKIERKAIMQFSKKGKYIRTIPSVYTTKYLGDENGAFDRKSVSRCARRERNTYRDYIWIYKEDYTEEILQERLDLINKRFNSICKPVVVLDTDGNYITRYESITEGADKEYVDRTSLMAHMKRKHKHNTCAGYIWLYEEEYNKNYNIKGA